MCGICGIYNYRNKQTADKAILQNMTDVLAHRGPDDEGLYLKEEIGLGHRRLSIIDLYTGKQPMSNEDNSIWIIFNGEIYNYRELREEIKAKGHILRTTSDTEVIIHLYEEMQEDCVEKLNGIFAFCIWDAKRKKIILVRDRLGVKPLFYALVDEGVIFASEVKSILQHHSVKKEIDIQALDDFFSLGYITGGKTIIKSIKNLSPATILSISKDSSKTYKYWDIGYNNSFPKSEKYYIDKLLHHLASAVKIQMVSDVPVGAFLSGGLDSSCVVSFMLNSAGSKIRTYSIGFLEKSYDELRYAQMAGRFFSTKHKDMIVKPDIKQILPKLIWFYDEPFADTSTIPTYFLAKLAASELKVVLSGDGGDENFAGYPTYVADKLARYYNMLPNVVKSLAAGTINKLPVSFDKVSFDYKAKRFIQGVSYSPLKAHYSWRLIYTEEEKEQFYSHDFKKQLNDYSSFETFENFYNCRPEATIFQKLSYVDFKTWLVDDILRKVDRASMANSLEARVPLLDHNLVEFAAAIPENLKLKRIKTKYLLKKSMKNRLPKKIIYRKKSGFNAPVSHWVNNELRSYVLDHLSSSKIRGLGYFQDDFVQTMLKEHSNRTKDNGLKIWSLLNFVIWYEIFIESKSP